MRTEPEIDEERENLEAELFRVNERIRNVWVDEDQERLILLRKRKSEIIATLAADSACKKDDSDEWQHLIFGEVMQEGDEVRSSFPDEISEFRKWRPIHISQVGAYYANSSCEVRRRKPIDASFERVRDVWLPYLLEKADKVAKRLPDEQRAEFRRSVAVLKTEFAGKITAIIKEAQS